MNRKARMSRRDFLKMGGAAAGGMILASCTPATPPPPTAPPATLPPTAVPTATPPPTPPPDLKAADFVAAADMPGSPKNPRGWTTLLPDIPPSWAGQPPISINITRRVDDGTQFAAGDTLENNPWTRMVKEVSGTDFKVAWTWTSGDEANTKYNLAMASNQLPDYMETIPVVVFQQMAAAGMLEDITDAFDKFASDKWKNALKNYGNLPWLGATYKGRRYGLPYAAAAQQDDSLLWYRKDWLDKLNLKVPTTLDELHDVAVALANSKLGKGEGGLTVGLGADKYIYHDWSNDLSPIWGAYGIIPDRWSKEGNGLMFDGIRPEAKQVLALLAQWYKDGVFRKDFYTLETGAGRKDVKGSINGLNFCPFFGFGATPYKNDPNCVFAVADVPTGPGGKQGKYTSSPFSSDPFGFRKGVDPKVVQRVIELENWMIELREDPTRRFHGWENNQYKFLTDNSLDASFSGWVSWAWMIGPIGSRGDGYGDPTSIAKAIKYYLDNWTQIAQDKRDAYEAVYLDDPVGNIKITQQATVFSDQVKGTGLLNEFQGLPTPTMATAGTDMQTLMDTTYIGIINGQKKVDDFDDFVKQWKALGGDQVTKEVNDWYTANKA